MPSPKESLRCQKPSQVYADLSSLMTSETTNNTRKIKNRTWAMLAAPAAIPLKPNIAAMIATTKKRSVNLSIVLIEQIETVS
jgi:hypothetical protein